MKHFILPFSTVLISTSLLNAYPKDFSGGFTGSVIGGTYGTVGASSFTAGGAKVPSGTNTNNGGGISGGAMAGYLFKLSPSFPLHIGPKIGTIVSSLSGTESTKGTTTTGTSTSIKHKYTSPHSLQASLMVGYPVSNTVMPFSCIGWQNTLWKHKISTTAPSGTSAKNNKRQNALLAESGVMKKLTKNASAGFLYQGAFQFGSQKAKSAGVSAKLDGAQTHNFLAFLAWHFK